jgi:hypothetical protein
MTLEADGKSFLVGAIDAAGRRALLPVYAVTPYLFAGDEGPASPHEVSLDSISEAFLAGALEALVPAP